MGLVVLILLTMTLREGFDATDKIKDPATWDAAEIQRIREMVTPESKLSESEIRDIVGGFWRYEVPRRGEPPTPKGWSVFTSTVTLSDVNEYVNRIMPPTIGDKEQARDLLKAYYIDQGQTVFQQARNYVASYTSPDVPIQNPTEVVTPPPPSPESSGVVSGTLERPTLTESVKQDISTYAAIPKSDTTTMNVFLEDMQTFYDEVYFPEKDKVPAWTEAEFDEKGTAYVESIDPNRIPARLRATYKGALESILDSYFSPKYTVTPTSITPAGPTGEPSTEPGTGATGGTGGVPGSAGEGATSGTTTGGSSGYSYGPTSGPSATTRNVWGPIFRGLGDTAGPMGGDSTKSNAYPSLLGGLQGRESTRLEGVGIVPPSGFGLDGILPSSGVMGSDPNARFLPYSRQPGDQDLIPDPYRLAKNFSTSSYSVSKTDPVPFLTDFSSFYK